MMWIAHSPTLLACNMVCGAAFAALCVWAALQRKPHVVPEPSEPPTQGRFTARQRYVFCAILALGIALRAYRYATLPDGINQDEASMAYDAFAIARYGIDRNGYRLPVYTVAWGSGQNVLNLYLVAPLVYCFGLTMWAIRLPSLLLGIATLAAFPQLARRVTGARTALISMFLLAISPWHVMLSRWALESNMLPGVFALAVCALLRAAESRRTPAYLLAAALFAVSLYAYALAGLVIPLFLLTMSVLLWRQKLWTLRQLGWSALVFAAIAWPLGVCLAVNWFDLPSMITPLFSAPRLSAMRQELYTTSIPQNLFATAKMMVSQYDGMWWNLLRGFGICYLFALPFAVTGFVRTVARCRRSVGRQALLAWLACAALIGCLVEPNSTRLNLAFLPWILLIADGIAFVAERSRRALAGVLSVFTLGAALFSAVYFHPDTVRFEVGFGEAIQAADAQEQPVFVAGKAAEAMRVLFYTQMPPQEYLETVRYDNPYGEFRNEECFGKYTFTPFLPTDEKLPCYVYDHRLHTFPFADEYDITQYQWYAVAVRKQ